MALVNRLLAALGLVAALVVVAVPAASAELTSTQRDTLAARIESFDAAMKASDMAVVLGVVPPKMLDKIAVSSSVTTAQLIAATQEQIDEALKSMTIVSFGMALENAEIAALADGSPYALIPTETVIDMGEGGKYRARSSTLGLLDGETWYLVRIEDEQQVALLKEIYPAFADVVFPTGSMEPVAE